VEAIATASVPWAAMERLHGAAAGEMLLQPAVVGRCQREVDRRPRAQEDADGFTGRPADSEMPTFIRV
jgi:hypothetical protein